jgi:hypoxanthine phosphoribosyltransferase
MGSRPQRHIIYTQTQIESAVSRLAAEITADYRQRNPVLIGILKGVFVFMADLVRRLDFPLEVEFVRVSSYGSGRQTSGKVNVVQELRCPSIPA